jgi:myo-inositol-1(or 4)-monophosphatase
VTGNLAADLLQVAQGVGIAAAKNVAALRPDGRVEVAYTKSSATDAVTAIDRASEEFIRTRILAERPDDTIIGEEGDDRLGTSSVTWLVDPIDGTVNFIYGIPAYAVSIAASVDGEVVAGFVINVVSGESWGASAGGGARHSTGYDRPDVQLSPRVTHGGSLAHALVATGFNYVPDVRARQASALARMLPQIRDIRRFGSAALDLCALASGRVDAYVEQGLQPWDLAAGVLIVREAGIVVAGLDSDGAVAEPSERLVMAAPQAISEEFFGLVLTCGF